MQEIIFSLQLSIINIVKGSQNYYCMTSFTRRNVRTSAAFFSCNTYISLLFVHRCDLLCLSRSDSACNVCVGLSACCRRGRKCERACSSCWTDRTSFCFHPVVSTALVFILPAYFKTKHHSCCSTQQEKKCKNLLPSNLKLCIKCISFVTSLFRCSG